MGVIYMKEKDFNEIISKLQRVKLTKEQRIKLMLYIQSAAEETEITTGAVGVHVSDEKAEKIDQLILEGTLTDAEIARECGVSRVTVGRHRKRIESIAERVGKKVDKNQKENKKMEDYFKERIRKYTAEMDEKYGKYYEYLEKEYGKGDFPNK